MSSIRSILEKINPCMCSFKDGFAYDSTKPCHCSAGKVNNQALLEISQIIDVAKPEIPVADSWQRGIEKAAFEDAIRVYQYKIKELLK